MLAFAERSWQGGGQKGWVANIKECDATGFSEFENRLLDHKISFFSNKPFAYAKQSGLAWQLFGPFDNEGNLAKKFEPEYDSFALGKLIPFKEVRGGTIVLRHWCKIDVL